MDTRDISVAIVGAGASGLAAAAELFDAGLKDVVVVEAADRIGGRVSSVRFGGEFVEEGAQYIHGGVEGNVAYEMASDMDLLDEPDSDSVGEIFYKDNGDRVSEETTDEMWSYWDRVEEILDMYDTKQSDTAGEFFSKTVREVAREKFMWGNIAEMLEDFWHRTVMIAEACDNWYEVSLYWMEKIYEELKDDEDEEVKDVTYKSNRKYADLLKYFTDRIPDGTIRLETRVEKVIDKGNKINLQLGEGKTLEADCHLYTFSGSAQVGGYKQHVSATTPPKQS